MFAPAALRRICKNRWIILFLGADFGHLPKTDVDLLHIIASYYAEIFRIIEERGWAALVAHRSLLCFTSVAISKAPRMCYPRVRIYPFSMFKWLGVVDEQKGKVEREEFIRSECWITTVG